MTFLDSGVWALGCRFKDQSSYIESTGLESKDGLTTGPTVVRASRHEHVGETGQARIIP